jgi:hypothetical protein
MAHGGAILFVAVLVNFAAIYYDNENLHRQLSFAIIKAFVLQIEEKAVTQL